MLEIFHNPTITPEAAASLAADPRCTFGSNVVFEDGASIFLDPKARSLTIMDGCRISRGAHIEVNGGGKLSLGKNVTVGRDSTIAAMCSIEIGDGVGVANGVSIRDHNHRTNAAAHLNGPEPTPWSSGFEAAPILIERMAILSDAVRVLPGVRVGQNTLVGAGVHLRHSVPPNCVVVGDSEKIRFLERFSAPVNPTTIPECRFHFFGDSLIDRPSIVTPDPHYDLPPVGESVQVLGHETAGFYKLMLQRLQASNPQHRFDFRNFAAGGSTIRDVKKQVAEARGLRSFWDVSFICVGINDIWRKYQGRGAEAVGLAEFSRHYTDTIEVLKMCSRMVFCIGEPLVSVGNPSKNINGELGEYNDFINGLAAKNLASNVYYIDLLRPFERHHALMAAYNPEQSLWIDGVHLSPLGNTLAADLIIQCLEEAKIRARLFRLNSYERDEAQRRYNS